MAFAVVERFKHESLNVCGMSAPGQKSSRCGEVAVSGGSTVYIHLTLNGHLAKTDSYSCYLPFFLLLVDLF